MPDPKEYEGLTIYYETQERAFAPGIANGWPQIIPAPHTKNGRLRRLTPDECRAIHAALYNPIPARRPRRARR